MGFLDKFKKQKPNCPYCEASLDPVPTRKKKCPSCGQFIYVRRRPSDRKRILVTEEDAKRIEEEWKRIHEEQEYKQLLEHFSVSQKEYQNREKDLLKKFKTVPSQRDVFWAILNDRLLEAMKGKSWGKISELYREQAHFLIDEGKDPFRSLQESMRCQLRDYHSSGVVKKVQVYSAGNSSCDKCKELRGKILTVEQALETMPIPVDNCANSYGYCRCVYLPIVD